MKKLNKNELGFSAVEGLLILAIIGIIGGVGYFVYNSQKDTNKTGDNTNNATSVTATTKKTAQNSQKVSTENPMSKGGIIVTSPINNASVSSQFTITGTAPKEQAGTALSIYIDNDADRYYKTVAPVNSDGTFSVTVDLTGTQVVQHVPNVTEKDTTVTYKSVGAGKHTFHLTYDGSQSAPKVDGPTLTLIVQ